MGFSVLAQYFINTGPIIHSTNTWRVVSVGAAVYIVPGKHSRVWQRGLSSPASCQQWQWFILVNECQIEATQEERVWWYPGEPQRCFQRPSPNLHHRPRGPSQAASITTHGKCSLLGKVTRPLPGYWTQGYLMHFQIPNLCEERKCRICLPSSDTLWSVCLNLT